MVENTEDWAVIARPAQLRSISLLSLLVIKDHAHIGPHDDDAPRDLRVRIHRDQVLLGVESNVLDLAEGLGVVWHVVTFTVFLVLVIGLLKLALVSVVDVADVLLDAMESLMRIRDENLKALRRALLLGDDREVDLEVFAHRGESWDGLERRWLDQRGDSRGHVWHPEKLAVDGAENERVMDPLKFSIADQR